MGFKLLVDRGEFGGLSIASLNCCRSFGQEFRLEVNTSRPFGCEFLGEMLHVGRDVGPSSSLSDEVVGEFLRVGCDGSMGRPSGLEFLRHRIERLPRSCQFRREAAPLCDRLAGLVPLDEARLRHLGQPQRAACAVDVSPIGTGQFAERPIDLECFRTRRPHKSGAVSGLARHEQAGLIS